MPIDRPIPITVKLADVGRKMYETLPVDEFIAHNAMEIDNLKRAVEHWKSLAVRP